MNFFFLRRKEDERKETVAGCSANSSVQPLSFVWFLATPWTAAHQASLSITNSRSLLKLTSIRLVMPSNHLILCCPLRLLPSIFQLFESGSQIIGASSSVSVLPMNIQDWFPLGLTGLISLQAKGLSSLLQHRNLKASVLQHSAFFMIQLSHLYMTNGKNHSFDHTNLCLQVMFLLFNMLSRFVKLSFQGKQAFFLISWLQSLSAVILQP